MKYLFPPDTRLYCRTCVRLTIHNEHGGEARCDVCKRPVHTAELVSIYATDTDRQPGTMLFPEALLSPLAYARRFQQPDPEDMPKEESVE